MINKSFTRPNNSYDDAPTLEEVIGGVRMKTITLDNSYNDTSALEETIGIDGMRAIYGDDYHSRIPQYCMDFAVELPSDKKVEDLSTEAKRAYEDGKARLQKLLSKVPPGGQDKRCGSTASPGAIYRSGEKCLSN